MFLFFKGLGKNTFAVVAWVLLLGFGGNTVHGQLPAAYESFSAYNEGLVLFAHEQYGAAYDKFTQYLTLRNENPLDRLQADNTQQTERVEAGYYQAMCAYHLLRENASTLLQHFLENHPDDYRNLEARYYWAKLLFLVHNYPEAGAQLKPLEDAGLPAEQQADVKRMMGLLAWVTADTTAGQTDLAQYLTESNTENNNDKTSIAFIVGIQEYNKSQYDKALGHLQIAEKDPEFAEQVVPYIAGCLLRLGKGQELEELGTRVLHAPDSIVGQSAVLVLAGEAAMNNGHYEQAIEMFKDANHTPDWEYRMGMAYYKMNKPDSAILYLEHAMADTLLANDIRARANYTAAYCYLKTQQPEAARYALERGASLLADTTVAEAILYDWARLSLELNNAEQAALAAQKYVTQFEKGPHIVEMKNILAESWLYASNYDEAIKLFVTQRPNTARAAKAYATACYYKAQECINKQNTDSAMQLLKQVIIVDADPVLTAQAHFWKAEIQYTKGAIPEAAEDYRLFLNLKAAPQSNYYNAGLLGLGWCLLKQSKCEAAYAQFGKILVQPGIEKTPTLRLEAATRRADCKYLQGKPDEALRLYTAAQTLTRLPKDYLIFQKGMCWVHMQKYADAQKAFKEIIDIHQNSTLRPDAMIEFANVALIRLKQYDAAIKNANRVIEEYPLAPKVVDAKLILGLAFYYKKDTKMAVSFLKAVITDKRCTAQQARRALEVLSDVLKTDEYDSILAQYRAQSKGNAVLEELDFAQARAQYYGNDAKAKKSLEDYLNMYPNGANAAEAYGLLGNVYAQQNENEKAYQQYEKGFKAEPTSEAQMMCGFKAAEMLAKQNEYAKAYDKYLEINNKASEPQTKLRASFGMAEVLLMQGKHEASVQEYEKILASGISVDGYPEGRAQLGISKAFLAMHQPERALLRLQKCAETQNNEYGAEAQYLAAKILYESKNYALCKEAVKTLEQNFGRYKQWQLPGKKLLAESVYNLGDKLQSSAIWHSLQGTAKTIEEKTKAAIRAAQIDKELPHVKPLQGSIRKTAAPKQALPVKKQTPTKAGKQVPIIRKNTNGNKKGGPHE